MRCPATAFCSPRLPLKFAAAIFLAVFAVGALSVVAVGQGRDVSTTAVIMFEDKSGRASPLLQAKATDAVALALADSKEYLVTPARDVEREARALGLIPPLSRNEAVRLGKRLDVDAVTVGEILQADVDESTGRASVRLQIMMVDVAAGEYLDGATVSSETKALPGWAGSEADILNEAMREASEEVVANMLATRVPRGTIEVVLPAGACEINLGSQDGAKTGMKLVVLRPIYLRELEKMTLRKIGRVEIADIHPDICYANPIKGVAPRTGDYALRVYEPIAVVRKAAAKQTRTQFVAGVGALALLLAFAMVGTDGNETSAPPTPISYLHQSAMGAVPVIRVRFAALDKAHGHLLFRGHSAGFPADAPYLVEVSAAPNGEETIPFMDDQPQALPQQDRTITVNFRNEDGDPETEDVDVTWTHPALIVGETYFHKMRRVTKPAFPPGTNPPLATGGGTDNIKQDPTNTIDSGHDFPMISQPTRVVGPVTYLLAAQLLSPRENNTENMAAITFEWAPSLGADEYMVEVFDSSDPDGRGQPIFRRTGVRARGATSVSETWRPATGDLQESSVYYWRVGARASLEVDNRGQGAPRVGFGSNELVGWVLSQMRSFLTAQTPPIPPAPSGVAGSAAEPTVAKTGKTSRADPKVKANNRRQTRNQLGNRKANWRRLRQQGAPAAGGAYATPFPRR